MNVDAEREVRANIIIFIFETSQVFCLYSVWDVLFIFWLRITNTILLERPPSVPINTYRTQNGLQTGRVDYMKLQKFRSVVLLPRSSSRRLDFASTSWTAWTLHFMCHFVPVNGVFSFARTFCLRRGHHRVLSYFIFVLSSQHSTLCANCFGFVELFLTLSRFESIHALALL